MSEVYWIAAFPEELWKAVVSFQLCVYNSSVLNWEALTRDTKGNVGISEQETGGGRRASAPFSGSPTFPLPSWWRSLITTGSVRLCNTAPPRWVILNLSLQKLYSDYAAEMLPARDTVLNRPGKPIVLLASQFTYPFTRFNFSITRD